MNNKVVILCIDDDLEICYALKAVIETMSWKAITACDVKQGIRLYYKYKPDLILMDYHMPNINGVEGVKAFRQINKRIPIIVFTIDENQRVADEFLKAGASDFAIKPIKAPDIISRIRLHLRLIESEKKEADKYDLTAENLLEKGIGLSTLQLITDTMKECSDYLIVEEISERTGLAYQTIYRYLQFLTMRGTVDVKNTYGKKGRPKQCYKLI